MSLNPYVVTYAGELCGQELVFACSSSQASCLVEELRFTDTRTKIRAVRPAPGAASFCESDQPHAVKNLEALYQAGMNHPTNKSDFCVQCRRYEFLEFPGSRLRRHNAFKYCRDCRPVKVATLPLSGGRPGVKREIGFSDFWSPDRGQEPHNPTVTVDLKSNANGWVAHLRTETGPLFLEEFESEKQAMKVLRWWYYTDQLHRLASLPMPKRTAQNQSRCQSCSCRITFLTTEKGSTMPVNGWLRVEGGKYQKGMSPHWAICPHAKEWKSGD